MKSFKKLFALVLAGMTAVNMSAAALAESEADDDLGGYLNEILPQSLSDENVDIYGEICRYAHETIPYCLPAHALYGTYDVSEPIRIHNWDGGADTEKYLVIVSENNIMVGSLTVEYVDSRIISAFRSESIPEINAALASGAEIQLGYSNDCFLAYSGNTLSVIENPYFVDETFVDELTVDPARSEIIQTAEAAASIQTRTGSWSVSGVKTVNNNSDPNTAAGGEGLCWAACVASMGMQKNRNQNYDALRIYYLCNNSMESGRPSGVPIGTNSWIKFALSLVGIPPYRTDSLTANQVISILSNNKPIMVFVKTDSAVKQGHDLVLYSYTEISGTSGQYVFMDPGSSINDAGIVSVFIDREVMNDGSKLFLVSRNRISYTYWQTSWYEQ